MATRGFDLRFLAKLTEDIGATPETTLDKTFSLSGFSDSQRRDITLASDADDVAVTFTDVAAVIVFSRDNRFSWRLADGETLVTNVMVAVFGVTDRITRGTGLDRVLLTGNGSAEAHLTVIFIEKEAA